MADIHGFEALAGALAQNPRSAALYVDADGTIRSWNRGAEILFGHTAADAIGRRADLIVPEHFRDAHWSGFNRAIASSWRGSGGWGPVEALHATGKIVAVEVFLLPVEQTADGLRGVQAVFRQRPDGILKS